MAQKKESSTEVKVTHGLLLAGGKSSRMGTNKALLTLTHAGKTFTLLDWMLNKMRSWVDGSLSVSGEYQGYNTVPDIHPDLGPLGGLHAACKRLLSTPENQMDERERKQFLLIIPVDMPLLTDELVLPLMAAADETDSCAAWENQELPCVLLLNEELSGRVNKLLQEEPRDRSLKNLLQLSKALRPTPPEGTENLFSNTNTPEAWRLVKRQIDPVND